MTEPRESIITVRVTKRQKSRIRRIAKRNGESVSALVLRAIEHAEDIPAQTRRWIEPERGSLDRAHREGDPPRYWKDYYRTHERWQ